MTLVSPDFSGATTLTAPASLFTGTTWVPKDPDGATLHSGTDYLLNISAGKAKAGISIKGGRHVGIIGGHISVSVNGDPNIYISGGDTNRIVWLEGLLIDCSNGAESDGIRTHNAGIAADTTILKVKYCRIENLRGQSNGTTDDFGNPSSATHADCCQLANGIAAIYFEDCTLSSRYANLQLQHEQSESGTRRNVNAAVVTTSVGGLARARITTATAHGFVVDEWAQMGRDTGGGTAFAPTGWNGTYQVKNVVDTFTFDINFGTKSVPSSVTTFGTVIKSAFGYAVGDISINRVNIISQKNGQQYLSNSPGETLNWFRFGGRPDFKSGNEDLTPLSSDGLGGTVTMTDFYAVLSPDGSGSVAGSVNPGSASTVYSVARADITGSVVSYPNWPAVTGFLTVGDPPNGDFCPRTLVGLHYPAVQVRGVIA